MSKVENMKGPQKMETKGSGDHKREIGGGRNDRSDKSHNRSDSRESRDRNKLDKSRDEKELNSKEAKEKDQKDSTDKDATHHDEKSGDSKSTEEKKFTGRCRLFVGNLTPDVSEDEFKKMFLPYGEVSEVYVNTSRGFGFIRLDYRQNAEAAKAAIDGMQRKGRVLRVRFATHGAALRVKNLHPFVSNELLEQAFNQFGELERAIVIVDDRGKATGEGLVEFVRKPGAQQALRRINEGVFLFGSDPKPIEVEPLEQKDEEDGMPEKFLNKNDQYKKEREKEPRFAAPGSFEYEFGMRWKQIDEMEKKRVENVKKEMEEARIKLEDEMQNALYEFQAEQIRQDLLRQQEELRRLEQLRDQDRMRRQQELEMRMSRRAEEERQRQQEERRRQEIMMRQQEMQQRRSGGRDELMAGMRGGDMSGGLRGEMAGGMRSGDMSGGHRGGDMQGGMRGDMQIGMRGGDMSVGMRGGDMPGGMRGGDMPGGMRGADMRGTDMRGGDMPGGMRNDIAGGGMRGGDMRGEAQAFGPQGMRGGQGRPEPQPLMGTQARAGAPPMQPPPAPPAGIGLERGQQGMGRAQGGAPNGEGSPNSNIPSLVSQSGTPMDQQSQKSQLRGSPGYVPSAKHHRRDASQFADADDEWGEGVQRNLYSIQGQHGDPGDGHWPQPVDRGDNHIGDQGECWRGVSLGGGQIDGRYEGEETYERMDESGWNGQTANSESLAAVDDTWHGDMPHSSNDVSGLDLNDRYLAEYSELCHHDSQQPASYLNYIDNKDTEDKHLTNPQIVTENYQSKSGHASGLQVNLNEGTGWADDSDTVSLTNQAAGWDYMSSTSPHQFDSPCKSSTSQHQFDSPCKSSTSQHQLVSPCQPSTSQHQLVSPCQPSTSQHQLVSPCQPSTSQHQLASPCQPSTSQHQLASPCKSSTSQHHLVSPCKPSTSQHQLESLGVHRDCGEYRVETAQKENKSLCEERMEVKNCGNSVDVEQNNPACGDEAMATEEKSAEVDEIDYSMALVPYVPPKDSSSAVSSPVSSPSPSPKPHHHTSSHFPNVSAATGFPIHPNPLLGQPTYVRLHPLHIAAAVAAQQQTQAAAAVVLIQQRNRLAAVAMQQQAAAVAAAAARGRATLLHQQMVRNRYMGAPVLVRQPFVPLTPGIPGPVRVRMRVRRSVLLTEELSMGP